MAAYSSASNDPYAGIGVAADDPYAGIGAPVEQVSQSSDRDSPDYSPDTQEAPQGMPRLKLFNSPDAYDSGFSQGKTTVDNSPAAVAQRSKDNPIRYHGISREDLQKPAFNIPTIDGNDPAASPLQAGFAAANPVATAAYNVAAKTVSGLTSPENAAITAAFGGLGIAAKVAGPAGQIAKAGLASMSAWFAAEGVKGTSAAADHAIEVTKNPKSTQQQIAEAWIDVAPAAAMAVGGGLGAIHAPFIKANPATALERASTVTSDASPQTLAREQVNSKLRAEAEASQAAMPEVAPAPPSMPEVAKPSLVSQIDSIDGKGSNPNEVNAQVNEAIISQPKTAAPAPAPEPVSAPAGVDYAAEQTRSNTGAPGYEPTQAAQAANQLPKDVSLKDLNEMGPGGFNKYMQEAKERGDALTNQAQRRGLEMAGDKEAMKKVRNLVIESTAEVESAFDAMKKEKDPVRKAQLFEIANDISYKPTFFKDILAAAESGKSGIKAAFVDGDGNLLKPKPNELPVVDLQDPASQSRKQAVPTNPEPVQRPVPQDPQPAGAANAGLREIVPEPTGLPAIGAGTDLRRRSKRVGRTEPVPEPGQATDKVGNVDSPASAEARDAAGIPSPTPDAITRARIAGSPLADVRLKADSALGSIPNPAASSGVPSVPARNGAVERPAVVPAEPGVAAGSGSVVGDVKLPKELAGAKPRYAFGANQFGLKFANDLDKALYILAQKVPSKADAAYLKFAMDATGMTETEARASGQKVKASIKELAKKAEGDSVIEVPEAVKSTEGKPKAEPVAPVEAVEDGLTQSERALKAQDPDTFTYLREQLEVGKQGTDSGGISPAEYKKAVDDAVRKMPAKPAPDEIVTEEQLHEADPNAKPGEPPSPPVEPPVEFDGAAYEDPIGPNRNTPDDLGIQESKYKQGLTGLPVVGDIFKLIKKAGGRVHDNILAANKRLGGVDNEYNSSKALTRQHFHNETSGLSKLARRTLTKHGVRLFTTLLDNGDYAGAREFANRHTRYGKEFNSHINKVVAALEDSHELQKLSRGEDVGYIENHFPRKVHDYKGLMKFIGEQEMGVAEKALQAAEQAKGRKLTAEESSAALENFIRDSRTKKAKPGYLKARTIEKIDESISKFYEPFDVALEDHFTKVTNDYYDRKYFGKQNGTTTRIGGIFGDEMANEIQAGRLGPEAQQIVTDNIRDLFALSHYGDGITTKIANNLRLATAAAYLGQVHTSVAQFGDVIRTAYLTNPVHTFKGFTNRQFSMADIGVPAEIMETAKFSGKHTMVQEAVRGIVKIGVGMSDQFNKGGMANAFAKYYADIINKDRRLRADNPTAPMTKKYQELRDTMARKYPNSWKEMLDAIGDRDYEKGSKMSKAAQTFLYDKLAERHPINASGLAQGFHAASPMVKPMYSLKSFWLTQLGELRTHGYELLKHSDTRARGIAVLAGYTTVVAMGQNMFFQYIRDLSAGKQSDPSDTAIGAVLQLGGLSRYNMAQVAAGHPIEAAVGFMYPVAGLVNEAGHDLGLVSDMLPVREGFNQRRDASGRQTTGNLVDFAKQSKLIRHTPMVGAPIYDRWGLGKTMNDERLKKAGKGKQEDDTITAIGKMIIRPNLKTDRKN